CQVPKQHLAGVRFRQQNPTEYTKIMNF
ncbi:uncharacterized protein METZ01_LOCUS297008, partial [marine metagenome]